MRTFLIILVAIVILGGGWYFYSQRETPMSDINTNVNVTPSINTTPTTQPTIPTSAPTTGATKEFTVTGSNFKFAPATMTVKKGDTVKITFVNSSGTHDWNLDEFNAHSGVIQAGATKTVTFVADKAGSFEYYCAVGEHRQMGMKGTLTVTP